jgi:hypothetical protein
MARRYQYDAETQIFSPPPIPPAPPFGWYVQHHNPIAFNVPPRTRGYITFGMPLPISIPQNEIGFHQLWPNPTLAARRNPEAGLTWVPYVPPPATPSQYGWFEPPSQPTYRPVDLTRHSSPTWVPCVPPPATPSQFGWYTPWLDPVRPATRPTMGEFEWDPYVPPPATPAQYGWFQPPSQPVLPRLDLSRHSNITWTPHVIGTLPNTNLFGWYRPWLDPVRPRETRDQGSFTLPPNVPPPPPTPSQFGWYQPWRDPIRLRETRDPGFFTFVLQPFTSPSFGWYNITAQPVYRRPNTDGILSLPFLAPTTPTPSQFGWYTPWLDPVRPPVRTQDPGYYSWSPQAIVPPIFIGFLVSLGANVIYTMQTSSAVSVSTLSTNGVSVTFTIGSNGAFTEEY